MASPIALTMLYSTGCRAVRAGLAAMIQTKKVSGPRAASANPSQERMGSMPRASCTSAKIDAAARYVAKAETKADLKKFT